ncbi:chorismate mutase [Mycobacterium saskatchewanense]|uniref:Chorismate mutase n=2 Tax=Mycobacterium saskatchewanense TaxID=220927 RepID=A0AAJ3NN27_9MYCO|nr:chorismate mutase [Mycobacterium saskatchewanense]
MLTTAPAPHARADISPLTPLVDAAAQRLQTADPVAAVKWHTHGAVEDPGRVRDELSELSAAAAAQHLDPGYVTRLFGDQIDATEAIEYGLFAEWKLNPAAVPAAPPDLSTSRSAIDRLNRTMLAQIAADRDALHAPACAAQLDAARGEVVAERGLDGLHERALQAATRSYCEG